MLFLYLSQLPETRVVDCGNSIAFSLVLTQAIKRGYLCEDPYGVQHTV